MINEETKQWFIDKIATNPEYVEQVYLPAVEFGVKRGEAALHQAIRVGDLSAIKYAMGWFDGVREFEAIIKGLRGPIKKEGQDPTATGLVSRILDKFPFLPNGWPLKPDRVESA